MNKTERIILARVFTLIPVTGCVVGLLDYFGIFSPKTINLSVWGFLAFVSTGFAVVVGFAWAKVKKPRSKFWSGGK